MSLKYVDEIALQENIDKTKEHVESVRATLDAQKQDQMEFDVMPSATASLEGLAVLYTGTTTATYTQGSIYKCQEVTPATDPKTYEWVELTVPIEMDSALDIDSTNGIQNGAVTNALQALQNGVVIIYANESALPSLVNYAGGIILAVGSVAFCVAEKTWHKVTAINPSSLAITWSAYNPNIALEEASTLPTASVDLLNKCYLYIGATTSTLDKGKIYQCQAVEVVPEGTEDPSALGWYELVGTTYELSADTSVDSSKTYYEIKWVSISSANLVAGKGITIEDNTINADTNIFPGTLDEWNALTSAEQENYDFIASPDEADGGSDVYSTTETKTNKVWIDGKPIYRKVVDCGALPSSASLKSTPHGISNVDMYTNVYGEIWRIAGGHFACPMGSPTWSNMPTGAITFMTQLSVGSSSIQIAVNSNASEYKGIVILEYTKTT